MTLSKRANRLYRNIIKHFNIIEDSYVISNGSPYYDIDQFGEDIMYNSEHNGVINKNLVLPREIPVDIHSWKEFRKFVKESFAKRDAIFMTSEAQLVFQEIIEYYDNMFIQ